MVKKSFGFMTQTEMENCIKAYMCMYKYEYSQPRAYDYARDAFRDYVVGKNGVTANCVAAKLYAYLATWGMCYVNAGSIRWKNYRVLEPIVDILRNFAVDPKYKFLRDYDPYVDTTPNKTAYVDCVTDIVERLRQEFDRLSGEANAAWGRVEADYEAAMNASGKSDNPPLQYGKINATDALIGKILLATLGCTVAYDSHARDALKALDVKRGLKQNELDDFYDKVIIGGKSVIVPVEKAFKMKYPALNYPIMKIIDMALWVYGI